MNSREITAKCYDIIEHWEQHGQYTQTKADKESFGEPIEYILAKRILELEQRVALFRRLSNRRNHNG